ncbi:MULTISPECIES: hypothetical protein [unclassified Streptomyces]|uniref:hypothetical protein n=1 Tax=unclassified Streptomyces TaxID=2593676 RepID=UPI0038115E28
MTVRRPGRVRRARPGVWVAKATWAATVRWPVLAEHEKTRTYPGAVTQAHLDFAAVQQRDHSRE